MMTHNCGMFTSYDDLPLYYQFWIPEQACATVLLLHGYGDHSGRYANVATALAGRGYAVWVCDLRGYGHSAGKRAQVSHFQDYVDDLSAFVQFVRRQDAPDPFYLLGNSMGSLVALRYAVDHQAELAGLILTSPAFRLDDGVFPLLKMVSPLASMLTPALAVMPVDLSLLNRDPVMVSAYKEDPLNYQGRLHARLGYEMNLTARAVQQYARRVTLPFLLVVGEADRISNPQAAYEMFEAAASPDKTLKRYPGLYHDVLHEPEYPAIVAMIAEWIDRQNWIQSSERLAS